MAITLVGTTKGFSTSGTSVTTAAFSTNPTVGNTIIVSIDSYDSVQTINTLTDSKGNTYTKCIEQIYSFGGNSSIWYAPVTTTGSSFTVTANVTLHSGHTSALNVIAQEWSGLANNSLDQTMGNGSFGLTPTSNTTATTTNANELLIGVMSYQTFPSSSIVAAGSGYTGLDYESDGNFGTVYVEYQIVSSTGTYAATFSQTSNYSYSAVIATFKAAPPPGSTLTGISSLTNVSSLTM